MTSAPTSSRLASATPTPCVPNWRIAGATATALASEKSRWSRSARRYPPYLIRYSWCTYEQAYARLDWPIEIDALPGRRKTLHSLANVIGDERVLG